MSHNIKKKIEQRVKGGMGNGSRPMGTVDMGIIHARGNHKNPKVG